MKQKIHHPSPLKTTILLTSTMYAIVPIVRILFPCLQKKILNKYKNVLPEEKPFIL